MHEHTNPLAMVPQACVLEWMSQASDHSVLAAASAAALKLEALHACMPHVPNNPGVCLSDAWKHYFVAPSQI